MPALKLTLVAIILPLFTLPLSGAAVSRKDAPSNQHLTARLSGPGAVGTQADEKKKTPTVAILLFDRVEIIDFAGPWEVFGGAGYKVFTVAEKPDPAKSMI